MSIEGTAKTEYASLSGKIHTFVVDKTLSISGACADAKATGDAIDSAVGEVKDEAAAYSIEKSLEAVGEMAEDVAREAAVDAVADEVSKAISELGMLTTEEVREKVFTSGKLLEGDGVSELWSMVLAEDEKLAAADVKIATGSYTGTDALPTEESPMQLTFDFAPDIIMITGYYNPSASAGAEYYHFPHFKSGSAYTTISFIDLSMLQPNTWTVGLGLGYGIGNQNYHTTGKKSADGKTYMWARYGAMEGDSFNVAGYTYYYLAMRKGGN